MHIICKKIKLLCTCELLTDMVNCLKQKYSHSSKEISVFSIPSVKTELEYFHKYFVICPVDKASKNVSIICKRFYLETILNECIDNSLSYDHIVNLTVENICKKQKFFMSEKLKLNIDLVKKDDTLPHIFLFPKFHKPKLSQRFVVSYACCSIKPVAQRLTLGLKAINAQICRYCSMLFKVTGIKRNWIIDSKVVMLLF